jgi:hypothetical protein
MLSYEDRTTLAPHPPENATGSANELNSQRLGQ